MSAFKRGLIREEGLNEKVSTESTALFSRKLLGNWESPSKGFSVSKGMLGDTLSTFSHNLTYKELNGLQYLLNFKLLAIIVKQSLYRLVLMELIKYPWKVWLFERLMNDCRIF